MDPQLMSPQITLTNLLIGLPPLPDTLSVRNLDKDDIYRGPDQRIPANAQPSTSMSFNPMATQTSISSSSLSSSSSGMRFNVIPSIIERAISRWAQGRSLRRRGSFSSGTSASITSRSTASTSSDHTSQRKKSPASIRSHTTSITTRRQAIAMSRALPREFTLLLPPHLTISSRYGATRERGYIGRSKRELKTASLPLMLAQLGSALKRNAKTQRQSIVPAGLAEEARTEPTGLPTMQLPECRRKNRESRPRSAFEFSVEDSDPATPRANGEPKKEKGKLREVPRQFFLQESKSVVASIEKRDIQQSGWLLDVASPTWDDMKALGKLLHLHPLTLEDILQRESREKFEHFPRLGYYFVVFRAVDRPGPNTVQKEDDEASSIHGLPELTEVLEITNIYLIVFKEGICVFHFEDISRHMDTLKKKVLQLEGTIPMGSDWIAHGLMDSVVDAFFPILRDIGQEVSLVEDFVSGIELNEQIKDGTNPFDLPPASVKEIVILGDTTKTLESSLSDENAEKRDFSSIPTKPSKKGLQFKHYMQLWHDLWRKLRRKKNSESNMARDRRRLRRMTATRRLVNTLGRLLWSKAELIGQIRKRLHGQGDVAIYLGDVLDHVISLHQSLMHHERMLSHSHPAYLSHLRLSLHETKCAIDNRLIPLSVIALLVLCFQILTGLLSMYVNFPISSDYTSLGIVIAIGGVLCMALLGLARYWWVKAQRRRRRYKQL